MAARIRLRRTGTTKRPSYRVVVADARTARDGRFIEQIGFYDPLTEPPTIRIDADKATAWLRKGALPSNTVRILLTRAGVRAG
jgi:small subunit ribosomal protein S16